MPRFFKVVDADNGKDFEDRLNEASKQGYEMHSWRMEFQEESAEYLFVAVLVHVGGVPVGSDY